MPQVSPQTLMTEEDYARMVAPPDPVGFGSRGQLEALANWLGLALPGRGGIGTPQFPNLAQAIKSYMIDPARFPWITRAIQQLKTGSTDMALPEAPRPLMSGPPGAIEVRLPPPSRWPEGFGVRDPVEGLPMPGQFPKGGPNRVSPYQSASEVTTTPQGFQGTSRPQGSGSRRAPVGEAYTKAIKHGWDPSKSYELWRRGQIEKGLPY